MAYASSADILPEPYLNRMQERLNPTLQSNGTTNIQLFSDCLWIEHNTTNISTGPNKQQVVPQADGFHLAAGVFQYGVNPERISTAPTTVMEPYGTRWSCDFPIPTNRHISVHLLYGPQMDTNVIAYIEEAVGSIAREAARDNATVNINEILHNKGVQAIGAKARLQPDP